MFSAHHADEIRISDYLARDLRSALEFSATGTGLSTVVTIKAPNYYKTDGTRRDPSIQSDGTVCYKDASTAATTSTITYSFSNGNMIRTQNGTSVVIASAVEDFQLTLLDSTTDTTASSTFNLGDQAGKVAEVKTKIAFRSTFSAAGSTTGTAFYNTTLMRNARSDKSTFLY
jgi:hypothetical protein